MLDLATPQLPLWSDNHGFDDWVVRQSARARRLTVRVLHTGRVEVVVPRRTTPRAVQLFVSRHRDWIERKTSEVRSRARTERFPPDCIALSGCEEKWQLYLAGGSGRPRLTELAPGLLAVGGHIENAPALSRLLRTWLTRRAYLRLGEALDRCAAEMDLHYSRLLIRRQRTRWGSCSTRGTISLNCGLLFQRPQVVRYLLIHELSHLRYMNHSSRFWRHVESYCPDYRALDRELLRGWSRVPGWMLQS
jgi:predicted metal-dependent hydrolase